MAIFKITNSSLTTIKEIPLKLEKDLQVITENNLSIIFGLDFVSSEFALQQFRIDTLAFDEETKSFIIIEYKRDKSFSVIDQGYAYLALMLNNKADFILEYNEKKKKNLKREDIDWTQSKVLFLANSFTAYQQNAINFKDLPIELWEVKRFDNQTILYNQLKSAEAKESIKTVSKSKTIESVNREVKKYSIDDHFRPGWENSRELFEELRIQVLEIDPRIEEKPNKLYIGYQIDRKNIIGVRIQQSKIIVDFTRTQPNDLDDPKNKLRYRKNSLKYWNQHISEFDIKNKDDIDYAIILIKQAYKRFINKA